MKPVSKRILALLMLSVLPILSVPGGLAQTEPRPATTPHKVFLTDIGKHDPPKWLGPDGGLIASVAIYPRDPNIVYAGSWGGGVYKSKDGGKTWTWKSRGVDNLTIVSLAVDPSDPAVVYAGTYGSKLYKSSDGGDSWVLSSAGVQEGAIVYSIVIDPHDPRTVYMSTRGPSNNAPPWKGVVYRSQDKGASWTAILANLAGQAVQDWIYALAIHPNMPNVIFGATHEQGIYRSKDYGSSWEPANDGITNFSTRAVVFGPTPDTSDYVYTAVWEKRGVFKSDNLGKTWEIQDDGIRGAQIYAMDIDPLQPKVLYLATYNMGVMKTTSSARKWFSVGLNEVPIATVRINPADSRLVFAGTVTDGLYRSSDAGGSWAHSQTGLQASSATSLVISPQDPTVWYASTEWNGVQSSTDGGASWKDFSLGLGSRAVNALVAHPQLKLLFALTDTAGLYRCDLQNLASCWQHVVAGLPAVAQGASAAPAAPASIHPFSSRGSFFEALGALGTGKVSTQAWPGDSGLLSLVFAPSKPQVGYLGGAGWGVYRTADSGATWTVAGLGGRIVSSLAVNPQNPQHVYAVTDQPGGIQVSLDGGGNWANAGIEGVSVFTLAYSPANPGTLFAGTSNGVYRLAGSAWQPVGLAGRVIASLAFHPTQMDRIYAGTTDGAFYSTDGGGTWRLALPELDGHTVQSIQLSPLDPLHVYFSTTAHGVLRTELGK